MNTVIDAGQALIGDKVRLTFMAGDVTITREGVVSRVSDMGGLYTEQGYSLGPINDSVIDLLDRPKPKIVLPTGRGAVVKYAVDFDTYYPERTALRSVHGHWKCYNAKGEENDDYSSDEDFAEFLDESNFPHTVLFEGVAK